MMPITLKRLPRSQGTTIIRSRVKHVTILALCLLAHGALAQQQTESKPESKSKQGQDDLDVTMQIIVDPDAKLPDEVVRRIPLPERKPAESAATSVDKKASNEAAAEAKQNASEAKELGKKEAAEQREQARRARAEERERNNPPGNPNPPGRPPH
jgi:hypothetical protein